MHLPQGWLRNVGVCVTRRDRRLPGEAHIPSLCKPASVYCNSVNVAHNGCSVASMSRSRCPKSVADCAVSAGGQKPAAKGLPAWRQGRRSAVSTSI